MTLASADYFRGDQKAGITAPDLLKACDYADHIVHARGKKTKFTSVSLDCTTIRNFGEVYYLLLRDKLADDGHIVIEHETLISWLRVVASTEEKAGRIKAIQALRSALRRKEGLVDWKFDVSGVERKDVITWAFREVQAYFKRL